MPQPLPSEADDVLIVGGGLAGLAAATAAQGLGQRWRLLEARGELGGRVQTDRVDGFLLDRGFQVYLTAYPTASQLLDYASLRFGAFVSGALIRIDGRFRRLSDPTRDWRHIVSSATSPVGSLSDKLRIAMLKRRVLSATPADLLGRDTGQTTEEFLKNFGFSSRVIDGFFRPFFGGIFLDRSLDTAANRFLYLFHMFAAGSVALPAEGMVAIPAQLTRRLPADRIERSATAASVRPDGVTLTDGSERSATRVLVATEAPAADRLLGRTCQRSYHSTLTLYFVADRFFTDEPILMLRGDSDSKAHAINSVAVLSAAQPTYAPAGKRLISVSALGRSEAAGETLETDVRSQLVDWYGTPARDWPLLRIDRIRYGLPDQSPSSVAAVHRSQTERIDGITVAGDYFDSASIEGALRSGLAAIENSPP